MTEARTTTPELQLIQIFRGVAATIVVLTHLTQFGVTAYHHEFMWKVFVFGHSGIDFFFVLSGFIMVYVHHANGGNPRNVLPFLGKRFARVFPTYWAMLAVYILYFARHPGMVDHALEPATIARAALLYDQHAQPIIAVAWTLSYEVLFYLFFALYILAGARVFAVAALTWAAVIIGQWAGLYHTSYRILLSPMILEFFLGCIAGAIVVKWRPHGRIWWVLGAAGICAVVAVAESREIVDTFKNERNFGIPYFLLVLAGASYDLRRTLPYPRPLVLLGEASYSIYLMHYLGIIVLLTFAIHHTGIVDTIGVSPLLWLVCGVLLASGVTCYSFVEQPLIASTRRWLRLAPPGV